MFRSFVCSDLVLAVFDSSKRKICVRKVQLKTTGRVCVLLFLVNPLYKFSKNSGRVRVLMVFVDPLY